VVHVQGQIEAHGRNHGHTVGPGLGFPGMKRPSAAGSHSVREPCDEYKGAAMRNSQDDFAFLFLPRGKGTSPRFRPAP
jgi:hypothetical protein